MRDIHAASKPGQAERIRQAVAESVKRRDRYADAHAADPREYLYDLDTFANADTHDPLWNAAQRQLRAEGRIHNYLRMLWGKKILEWTPSPRHALEAMTELNNRYALDGRDPNSTSFNRFFICHSSFDVTNTRHSI